MSKVLIDRAVLEATLEHAEFVSGAACDADDAIRVVLTAGSGTPELPVKAYYHESPNEYGGLNKSVGLEQRKTFADAPLVLESDALVQIACLEGEIAKRDARIVELEEDLAGTQSRVLSLQNQWRKLDAELAAIKAQEPVAARVRFRHPQKTMPDWSVWQQTQVKPNAPAWTIDGAGYEVEYQPLYAAPVSEAKAHGVVMPERLDIPHRDEFENSDQYAAAVGESKKWNACLDEVARLNAAPVQEAGDGMCNEGNPADRCICREEFGHRVCGGAPVQQVSVPDGWRLVPVEPTHEMLGAALMNQVECLDAIEVIRTDYKAMMAAAPTPGDE